MVRVYHLGHGRAGDKGDISNVSVVAYNDEAWHILERELTAERVMDAYVHIAKGPVTRYELPNLRALNFVIEGALGGGVTRSLAQDMHGKSLSTLILTIDLPVNAPYPAPLSLEETTAGFVLYAGCRESIRKQPAFARACCWGRSGLNSQESGLPVFDSARERHIA